MGRNTTTPSPSSLDRYSIGEIVDISGVPNYYDAGTSKWLRSGTYVSGSNLSSTTKSTLAASALSAGSATVALATSNDTALMGQFPSIREQWQVARISSINTTVIPLTVAASSVNIMVINSSGATVVQPVASTQFTSGTGATFALTSNDSKFFIYYYSDTNTLACKSSTDGFTWTTETLSNLPSISGLDSNSTFWDWNSDNQVYPDSGYNYRGVSSATYGTSAVLWCGARFLLLTRIAGPYMAASLSSDGVAFSANSASSVLGNATLSFNQDINFYKNGNTCFLAVGSTFRKSTDGGVTWSGVTASIGDANNQWNIPNTTDPTKRIINLGDGNTSAYYTSDSGATWSSNRVLPLSSRYGLVYKGSTVVTSYTNGCYRSVDDGVTWTSITFPAGTNSSNGQILADAYRFYFIPHGYSQVLTSTDAITWTITSGVPAGSIGGSGTNGIVSVNSSIIYITLGGMNQGIFSLDGGVTWAYAATSTGSAGNSMYGYYTTPTIDGPSGGYLVHHSFATGNAAYNFFLSVAALTAGGAFYRTGSSAISPVRTNALAYVRVG